MRLKNALWFKAAVAVVTVVSLLACGGSGGGSGSGVNDPRVRYVNASPDASPVTFTLDGDVKASGVAYLGLSPNFVKEDQDSYDIAAHEDGDNPDFDAIAANFTNDNEYLVACVGLVNYGTEFLKRIRLRSLAIDLTVPNGNKSRLYVLHAFNRATGFDTPDIDLRNPGDNPQYKVENIAFGNIGTLEIDASTQTFVARRSESESVYATNTGTFDAGGIYLVIVGGLEGAIGIQEPKLEFIKLN